jgi:putative ABC transport system substrate-binding protein
MRRRGLLKSLCALGLVVWPPLSIAQPPQRPYRIGLGIGSPTSPKFREALVAGMRERGWREGEGYVIVSRGGVLDSLAKINDDVSYLLEQKVDILIVGSTAGAVQAHRLTKSVPIVMLGSGYPVEAGVADSLARPGRNVTGNALYAGHGIWGKLLDLLRECKPGIKRIVVLWGYVPPLFPAAEVKAVYDEFKRGAAGLGLSVRIEEVALRNELPDAVKVLATHNAEGIVVSGWLTLGDEWQKVVDYCVQHHVPTIADFDPPFTQKGQQKGLPPLLVYSPTIVDLWRQAIGYIDRILRGAKPGELPIQLPSRFELTVNLQTARTIGLKVPQTLTQRADRIVD